MDFDIGDEVEWTSSSNGTTKKKQGVVEAVIPKGSRPTPKQCKEADAYGYGRDHESYVVRCGKTDKCNGKLYWPRASALTKVTPNAETTGSARLITAELKRGQRNSENVLAVLAKHPRVSTWDMSELSWLRAAIDDLERRGLIESRDESYPWHRYAVTDAGRLALTHDV